MQMFALSDIALSDFQNLVKDHKLVNYIVEKRGLEQLTLFDCLSCPRLALVGESGATEFPSDTGLVVAIWASIPLYHLLVKQSNFRLQKGTVS